MSQSLVKITARVNRMFFPDVMRSLKLIGINHVFVSNARSTLLEKKRMVMPFAKNDMFLHSEPVELVTCIVTPDVEDTTMSLITSKARLGSPGLGSIYSEDLKLEKSYPDYKVDEKVLFSAEKGEFYTSMTYICCTVARGLGDLVSRLALEMGAGVPAITFSTGRGFRDRLGLVRVTIPAEKETIHLAVSTYETPVTIETIIKAAKLDQPGRGFIFYHDIRKGLLNTKLTRGSSGQAATLEQIVSALDGITGGIKWRTAATIVNPTLPKQNFLIGKNLLLIAPEEYSGKLANVAMAAGALGATSERVRYLSSQNEKFNRPSHVAFNMMATTKTAKKIIQDLEHANAFSDEVQAMVFSSNAKAFTFRA